MQNKTIHGILAELLSRNGIRPTELSRRTGVPQSTLSRILSKKILIPSDKHVSELANYFGVTTDQMWGREALPGLVRENGLSNEIELQGALSPWDSGTPLDDDEVFVPMYKEVELAAGSGATAVEELPGRKIRFARSTLREAMVDPANAIAAQVTGNSMERLIMHGATIGIDTGTTSIMDGEIYALDQGGMLRVKYVYRIAGGGIRLRSENSDEHPDEIYSQEQAQEIRILGWVFWWSTVRRRRGAPIGR